MNIAPSRLLSITTLALGLICLAACNSTTLQSDWKAPDVGSIHFSKVLIIAIAPVDSLRRPAEEAIRAQITKVPTVASYELLPKPEDQADPKKVAEVIKANGVDGIITLRMLSLDDEKTYNPGYVMPDPYMSFSGYYSRPYGLSPYYAGVGYGYGGVGMNAGMPYTATYVPPSVTTDHIMRIETNIYNAVDGKLIWTSITKTKNPGEVNQLIAEVAEVVRAKMKEQQLIK